MPRKVIFNNHLRTLSHDALKVYVFLAHKFYRHLDSNIKLSLWELDKALGLQKGSAARARIELKDAGLIDFQVLTDQVAEYMISRDIDRWTSITTITNQ
jgi:hypothetical protein